ncbi:hypothetical protein [Nesterenkonia pannonica]|uniref:hypothetical protein n=1 Tax=Nesterenkonia pannonica TaxID=1548602 RepID=UPI002164A0A5|nr:hypothetical protein [Nesterenkonia pannonica]
MRMHSRPWVGSRLCALAASAALLLTACAEPPAAEEPTGDELDRAWRIAVGSDPLDRTIARIYSLAMNSRDQPTVVIDAERPAHEAAAASPRGLSLVTARASPKALRRLTTIWSSQGLCRWLRRWILMPTRG